MYVERPGGAPPACRRSSGGAGHTHPYICRDAVVTKLLIAFTLMPLYGSRALTMVFAGVTIACGILMVECDRYLRGDDTGTAA